MDAPVMDIDEGLLDALEEMPLPAHIGHKQLKMIRGL